MEGSARFPSLWKKRKRRTDFTTAKSLRLRLPEYPNGIAVGWQKIMIVLGSCSPYVRGPRQYWIMDSTPWILDSLTCIPDSKARDSGFRQQKFPGFRNPDSLTSGHVVVRTYGSSFFISYLHGNREMCHRWFPVLSGHWNHDHRRPILIYSRKWRWEVASTRTIGWAFLANMVNVTIISWY